VRASAAAGRILGWDALRGLCALAVASYHLLYWLGLAELHTFGSYGVYLFFVLSGASLAYNYQGRLRRAGDAGRFLATRWLRVAPLFLVVCVLFASLLALRDGRWVDQLPLRFALNASFAFGLQDPVVWALPVGGWSLGIEFAYYLAFPLLLPLLARRRWWSPVGLALCLLQWSWIQRTVGSDAGYAAGAISYHQVPAFAAYFFGGCVIGAARRARDLAWPAAAGTATWLALAVLLLALNPAAAGDELLGVRGAILFAACFVAVFASGQVSLGARAAPLARWLGDITYGCYLLHPLLFFGFAWLLWPRLGVGAITDAAPALRCVVLAGVLLASCLGAAASERWFESPVRGWGKRVLQRRLAPAPPVGAVAAGASPRG
jgi:peptidoglycan/LPS O-acetylase OafA/YrhL